MSWYLVQILSDFKTMLSFSQTSSLMRGDLSADENHWQSRLCGEDQNVLPNRCWRKISIAICDQEDALLVHQVNVNQGVDFSKQDWQSLKDF